MLPDPLHPAVVHLPIALAVLVPGFALVMTILIHRRLLPVRSWALVMLLQIGLVGSGWLALETGEREEERVERVVAERPIETHEEAAERFLVVAGLGILALGAGLLPQRGGTLGRVAGTVVSLAVLTAGFQVGHTGGELVYQHGAANAYVDSRSRARDLSATSAARSGPTATFRHDDDDD
ncbi:MAG TPA: hypothetical protein ENI85_04650 [Deltaproteobacteria bacterium]|nr:hypothetical protein [Deltaproteobacteria bacterium]